MLKQLRFGSRVSSSLAVLLLGALHGCADSSAGDDDGVGLLQEVSEDAGDALSEGSSDAGAIDVAPTNSIALTAADGVTVGRVTASGPGCPQGSWSVSASDDLRTYTVSFRALEAALSAEEEVSTTGCTLSIAPTSDGTRQYSAQWVRFTARGRLEDGVIGALELRHSYEGSPVNTTPAHAYEQGPFEGKLAIAHYVDVDQARWTPCSAPQLGVNVDLLLRLSNGVPRATGTLASGSDGKLVVTLMDRACPPAPDAGS